ncbi:MAG: M20/M25/M40 family metallo-hydrolase [Mailhella sp.]|nr:M20/M25/M40 family metallo-hydrolase [Mailhella sp.]
MDRGRIMAALDRLMKDERIRCALRFLEEDQESKIAELKEMALVSGAPFTEPEVRSPYFLKKLEGCGLDDCHIDEAGNVFGSLRGVDGPVILVESHLDTVFGPEVELTLREDPDGILRCPGIADDTASMANELSDIRAVRKAGLHPMRTISFGGTVGEEAPGLARGARHIMAAQKDIAAYIALDSGQDFDVMTGALACQRYEIILRGPGGHSWQDAGRTNAIAAMGRVIARLAGLKPGTDIKTTLNFGLISGGTTVNSIASSASMHIDVRSLEPGEKDAYEKRILEAVSEAVEEENAAHPSSAPIELELRPYGTKPGGSTPADSPIVIAALESARAVGLPRKICPAGSTNANFPISAGVPALCVNTTGRCGGMHSQDEWYDPADSWKGAQALLIHIFLLAGLKGVTDPVL